MTQLIEDKQEINSIIESKIKNKKIVFTDYYNIGIMKRNISLSIGTCPRNKNLLIIHAVEYRRSLEKRFANIRLK